MVEVMKLTTRVDVSGIKYSYGGDFEAVPDSIISIALSTLLALIPPIIIEPDSRASGLSIELRIVIALKPNITASSETEPLSEKTNRDSFCNLQYSIKPNGA
jgi:hypothetical protein